MSTLDDVTAASGRMALVPFEHIAALGSSFAAGPGIRPIVDRWAGRSGRNFAHLLAQKYGARLTDLSVSGATTPTILDTEQRVLWHRFAPQVDGVPTDADLVTITAGGNDLNYVGSLMKAGYAGWFRCRPVEGAIPPSGAEVVRVSVASQNHAVGSAEPWVTGFRPSLRGPAAFHPNAAGMAAIAALIELHLGVA